MLKQALFAAFSMVLVVATPALANGDTERACTLMRSKIADTGEIAANAIFLSGPLHAGLVEPLRAASDRAPDAMVVISSPGGSGTDVRAISEALELERRHVVISGQCLSACASHFVPRAASVSACDDAFIGLHGAYTPEQFSAFSTPPAAQPVFNEIVGEILIEERRLQTEHGLDPSFFECVGDVTKPLPPFINIDNPALTPQPLDYNEYERKPDYWAPPAYDLRAAGYPDIRDYPDQTEAVQQRAMEAFADHGRPARIWRAGDADGSQAIVTIDTRNRVQLESEGVCDPAFTG
jgi:hypothetical protein